MIAGVQQNRAPIGAGKASKVASLNGPFFWLSAFFVVYCTRPEDWIPGLGFIPLAKITGICALLGLVTSLGRTQRRFRDLPREAHYLLGMVAVLFLAAVFSPIWRGGAIKNTLDFSKVWIVWILTFLLVTDFSRLRRIIFIQSAAVAVVSVVSLVLGRHQPRLEGVLGGIYSNPNDLALSIVLTLPFALAFFLTTKSVFVKFCWAVASLFMGLALFRTASRAGFITLIISGAVCLWYFGVKGRRLYLIVVTALAASLLLAVAGRTLMNRFVAINGSVNTKEETRAHDSYEERKELMVIALHGIAHYPLLGLGARNFQVYSGHWRDVHMTYLQIAVEGGIPAFILYVLFFGRAFANLRKLRRKRDLDPQANLFIGALHSSLVGFAIGALFGPLAYQFFPYFAVSYTSALLAMAKEQDVMPKTSSVRESVNPRYRSVTAKNKPREFTGVR